LIWRDDDISFETDLKRFKQIQDLFLKYNVLHTIGLICKDIHKNIDLINFINKNNIDVQIHCWNHYDMTLNYEKVKNDLPRCIETIEKCFGKRPTVLYVPWNHSDEMIEWIAKENELTVSNKKISLSGYLRGQTGEVINFHSWSDECIDLEAALIKYSNENLHHHS
jgi:peptidoglycan/xylan/chitin deacetylase (PgdA/CDA1 family)